MPRRPGLRLSSPHAFPALMGGFGVAMGFAAFILIREEGRTPAVFLTGLLAAALTSYVIETVRERAEGVGHATRPEPERVLGLLVLLAIFEIFVSGVEKSVALLSTGEAAAFLDQVFVHGITRDAGAVVQLLLFAGLWVVLGGAAAWSVMSDRGRRALPGTAQEEGAERPSSLRHSIAEPLRRVGRGMALVAGIALLYVMASRLAITIWVLLTRPREYQPAFSSLLDASPGGAGAAMAQFPILLASGLERLAGAGRWGGVLLLAAAAVIVVLVRSLLSNPGPGFGRRLLLITLVGALVLLALGPFATSGAQLLRLLRIVGASALIWLAPLTVLTVARPRLGRSAQAPRVWGIVSLVVALLLLAITWERLSDPPVPLYVATLVVTLVVTSWLFLRGADVVRFWPLVALTLAIAAFEGSSLLQRLTFLTTFKEAALLQSAPLRGGDEAAARRGFEAVAQWRRDSLVDDASAALVQSVRDVPGDTTLAALDDWVTRVGAALDSTFARMVDATCQASGTPALDSLHASVQESCGVVRSFVSSARDDTLAASRWASVWDTLRAQLDRSPGRAAIDAALARDDAFAEAWFRLRWNDPSERDMSEAATRALGHLPATVQGAEPGEWVDRALHDASLPDSVRGWGILAALAVSAPPRDVVRAWTDDLASLAPRVDGVVSDIPLAITSGWELQRHRRLADLFEARYRPDAPAPAPPPMIRRAGLRPFVNQVRAVQALAFARNHLRSSRARRAAGEGFTADAGAMIALELALGASFAFWATAGLLAGIAQREPDDATTALP